MLRRVADLLSGTFAERHDHTSQFRYPILTLKQRVMPSATLAQKMRNLNRAQDFLSGVVVYPGETFSFWRLIGAPTQKRGFTPARTLIGGFISESEGGGLCQVSGIFYEAALRLELKIIERHAHSVDIYREDERFTPLGLDAAVVYGYKDLRFRNNSAYTYAFALSLADSSLHLTISTNDDIPAHDAPRDVKIVRSPDLGAYRAVAVTVGEKTIHTKYRIGGDQSNAH